MEHSPGPMASIDLHQSFSSNRSCAILISNNSNFILIFTNSNFIRNRFSLPHHSHRLFLKLTESPLLNLIGNRNVRCLEKLLTGNQENSLSAYKSFTCRKVQTSCIEKIYTKRAFVFRDSRCAKRNAASINREAKNRRLQVVWVQNQVYNGREVAEGGTVRRRPE